MEETKAQAQAELKMGRLGWNERIAYFLMYTGIIVPYFFISTYFLFFLTDTYGVSAMAGGMIITVARLWDAVNDPICGWLCDRTRTKIGSYRPWIFGFCIPVVFLTGLCFSAPDFTVVVKTIYIAVIYILFGMAHTCINMPAGILANVMTTSYQERGVLGVARELGSNIGQLICQNVGAALLVVFCGTGLYTSAGYMKTAWILGAISLVLILYGAIFCKERVAPTVEKVTFKDSLKSLFKNKYALNLGIIGFCFMLFLFFRLSWQAYFCITYLENPTLIAPLLTAMNLPPIAVLFITPWLIKKMGKRNIMIIGGAIIIMGGILFAIAQANVPMLYVASIVLGIGQALPLTGVWAALPDAADWGEANVKIRAPGIVYTYGTFMVKLGQAITAWVAGWILTGIGYDGTAAVQTAGAAHGIYMANWLMIVIAGALVIIASLPYRLDAKQHAEIVQVLNERRAADGNSEEE